LVEPIPALIKFLSLKEDARLLASFSGKKLSEMKKPFYFINTARGKNVKTKALVEGLKSGKVIGACLDVLEYEKSSFENLEIENEDLHYLLTSEKAIVTPHIAGWTHQSKIKLAQFIVDKILKLYNGAI
jgi:D-3-phosphoglycerate dehydrogenase